MQPGGIGLHLPLQGPVVSIRIENAAAQKLHQVLPVPVTLFGNGKMTKTVGFVSGKERLGLSFKAPGYLSPFHPVSKEESMQTTLEKSSKRRPAKTSVQAND
jgi:hypothetical protein